MSGWLRTLLWSLGGVTALVAVLWTVQRRMIYLPGDRVPPIESVLPAWSEAGVTTSDGERLGVWYVEPVAVGSPVVIVFNGNAGTRAGRAPLGEALARQGHGVVLFDYRGYGDSTGSPSEPGLMRDAEAVRTLVSETAPDSPVVYFGESLGAAVAIGLAVNAPPDAMILRSPFTSLADVAAVHFPLPSERFLRDRFQSEAVIGQIASPILIIGGSEDSIVPLEQSVLLHGAAREPKELVIINGAGHNDLELLSGAQIIEAANDFIQRSLGPES